jgi:putative peptidoglycan lipid II flippase
MQNTLLPAVYGTVAVVASLPLYWIGLKIFGLIGVALAVSFSAMIQVAVLFAVWNRRSKNAESLHVYITFAKSVLAVLPLGVVLWMARHHLAYWLDTSEFSGSLLMVVAVTCLFLLLMALGGWIFKVEGIRFAANRLMSRRRAQD